MTTIEFYSQLPKPDLPSDFEIAQIELNSSTAIAPGTDADTLGLDSSLPGSTIVLDDSITCVPFIDANDLTKIKLGATKAWLMSVAPEKWTDEDQLMDLKGIQLQRQQEYDAAQKQQPHSRKRPSVASHLRLI
jgi:hypothetical protein